VRFAIADVNNTQRATNRRGVSATSSGSPVENPVFVFHEHVADDELRAMQENQGLPGQFRSSSRDLVRFPREGEHILAGLNETLVGDYGLSHLLDGFSYQVAVVAKRPSLPDQRSKLQSANYNQPEGEPGELPGKRGKIPVYPQFLIGVGVGLVLFDRGTDLVLRRHRVFLGKALMVAGFLFLLTGIGAVPFGVALRLWRFLDL